MRAANSAHAQQQPAVAEARDVGLAVRALVVADGQVDDAQVEARGAEQQVEVAERIEVAEVGAVGGDALVVRAVERLGAAQRVAHLLAEQPREEPREGLVGEQVQEAHGPPFHRIDQARAVDELALAADERVHELRDVLRARHPCRSRG